MQLKEGQGILLFWDPDDYTLRTPHTEYSLCSWRKVKESCCVGTQMITPWDILHFPETKYNQDSIPQYTFLHISDKRWDICQFAVWLVLHTSYFVN